MSGDERSRKALTSDESKELHSSFIRLNQEDFTEWCKDPENTEKMVMADDSTKEALLKKADKYGVFIQPFKNPSEGMAGILESGQAPAVIMFRPTVTNTTGNDGSAQTPADRSVSSRFIADQCPTGAT